jgi:tetratricopeptide (TPR) repeat protein
MIRRHARAAAAVLASSAVLAGPARARAGDRAPLVVARSEGDRHAQIGDLVDDLELPTVDGRKDRLLGKGMKANVFVFFRPDQEHSLDTLKELAACEVEFKSKPVRFVGVVSDSSPADEVRTAVTASGVRMPVLVDVGDALYARLGVRLYPLIGVVDAKRKLVAWEPFRKINYCERARVRVRWLLGEASEQDIAKVDEPEASENKSTEDGKAKRHLNYARMLLQMGEQAQALAEVQKALLMAPSAAAYTLQGEVLAAMGKCPDAARAFDAALRIEPGNKVAQAKRSSCGG